MKFLFKLQPILFPALLTIYSINTFARDIILVENLASKDSGELLLKILEEKFNIPKQLIIYKEHISECSKKSEAILQLCMQANGDLDIVKINRFVIENSLSVFFDKGESL